MAGVLGLEIQESGERYKRKEFRDNEDKKEFTQQHF